MKQAMQPLMLARCNQCGACFDLQYDLASLGGDERAVERIVRSNRIAARTKLCWNCRL